MATLNPSEASLSKPSFTLFFGAFCCAITVCQTSQDLVEVDDSMPWDAQELPHMYKMATFGPNRLVLHYVITLARK